MSSLNLCQGLQSCLEPWIMKPNIQMLKLTPPKSKFSRSISPSSESESESESQSQSPSHTEENTTTTTITKTNNNSKHDDSDMKTEDTSGWSFLQCLTNTKETADDNKEVYVHPLVKRSSSMLSEKSLEMCTESLGSETGSLVIDNTADIITTTISSSSPTHLIRETKSRPNRSVSFPPPLTSMTISGVQVRPLREGGRLVLQAVTVSSSPSTYFHAERCDGRLRLCLVKDLYRSSNEDDDDDGYEDEEEDDEGEGEDVDGENGKAGGEIGIENLPRPSRCKEGGRELIWEPFWVAT